MLVSAVTTTPHCTELPHSHAQASSSQKAADTGDFEQAFIGGQKTVQEVALGQQREEGKARNCESLGPEFSACRGDISGSESIKHESFSDSTSAVPGSL